jgi:hypothetical protein
MLQISSPLAQLPLVLQDTVLIQTRGSHSHTEVLTMRFIKVQDEERKGEVAINLDLVREAHFGGGMLHLYFERSSSAQDDMTFTGENAKKIWAAMG